MVWGKSGGTALRLVPLAVGLAQGPEIISDLVLSQRMTELAKAYNPPDIERKIYERWEASGFFNPDNLPNAKRRKPFVISMPPPNITGELHLGHVLGFTIMDALIRYHRMKGEAALWVPGTDHAAIATQVVVERQLRSEGIDRHQLGRAEFLKRVWQWREQYGQRIVGQTKRAGASADWSRTRFTMDKDMTSAVQTAFKRLYDEGLIYRGQRVINWCPECHTAISDLEVNHQETPGHLWFIEYPLVSGRGSITVATTRPETMLGDTAVAVNPADSRYKQLVGQKATLPVANREIPIIADSRVDRLFGTGAVKVTPAHDQLDYELGQTHHLPLVQVIGFDGLMTAAAGTDFAGLTAPAARQKVIDRLVAEKRLVKTEDYTYAIATCSRSNTVIEPLVLLQWFVRTKPLAEQALRALKTKKLKIVPSRFGKVYTQWLSQIRDWNISRQIWWGHRLPVWYRAHGHETETRVSTESPGPGWTQDEDTLDTWFSSGLWTFSTLGWPAATSDLKHFHPTSVMVSAWDILFFWIARMVMLTEHFLDEVPFRTVFIHGLVLNAQGKKMSKSKGTGVDPIPLADKYGMDALRISLVAGNAPGQDFRYSEKKTEGYRNFANKLWNVARYILSHPVSAGRLVDKSLADQWILSRLQAVVIDCTKHFERFDLSAASQGLYDFVWHDLADWYIETSKSQLNPNILRPVLATTLKLLHPIMPFITEEIWGRLDSAQLLMIEAWPKPNRRLINKEAEKSFAKLQATVTALRNFRIHGQLKDEVGTFELGDIDQDLLTRLSGVNVRRTKPGVSDQNREILLGVIKFQFPAAAVERYESWRQKERQSLEKYIGGIKTKLNQESFIARAPDEVVEQERQKLAEAKERLRQL